MRSCIVWKTGDLSIGDAAARSCTAESGKTWQLHSSAKASANQEHLELGLQILATRAIPAMLAQPGETSERPLWPALILPEIRALRAGEMLLARATAACGLADLGHRAAKHRRARSQGDSPQRTEQPDRDFLDRTRRPHARGGAAPSSLRLTRAAPEFGQRPRQPAHRAEPPPTTDKATAEDRQRVKAPYTKANDGKLAR